MSFTIRTVPPICRVVRREIFASPRSLSYVGELGEIRVRATFGDDDWIGLISVGGKEYRCYLSRVEIEGIMMDAGRSLDGKFYRDKMVQKHKFTLIEI